MHLSKDQLCSLAVAHLYHENFSDISSSHSSSHSTFGQVISPDLTARFGTTPVIVKAATFQDLHSPSVEQEWRTLYQAIRWCKGCFIVVVNDEQMATAQEIFAVVCQDNHDAVLLPL